MKEENNLQGKTSRLLYFMSELEKGHKVNKTEYLKRFNIAERTFKDDLRELKENLKLLRDDMKIKYSRLAGTYEAEYNHGYGNLKYNQAVILSKILLESRALRVEEVREIIDTFVERAVDDRERQRIRNFTERELEEYKELSIYRDNKSKSILPHLSAIFDAIENQKPLSFKYTKYQGKDADYDVLPVSIMFNDHYFYCMAYKVEEKDGRLKIDTRSLRNFRLDRFKTVHRSKHNTELILSSEELTQILSDSDVRYHTFLMFSDTEKFRIRFRYVGQFWEVLEDDIPALKVIEKDTRSTVPRVIYEIETYGRDSFQRYIDRFNGVFTILELEKINK